MTRAKSCCRMNYVLQRQRRGPRWKNSVVLLSVTLNWRGVTNYCWIGVISWWCLHQRWMRWSRVLLGSPTLRCFCCSCLATPFLRARTTISLICYGCLHFEIWTGWTTGHGAGWHLLSCMSSFLLPPTQLLAPLVVTWSCLW